MATTLKYFAGFETGDFGELSTVTGTCTVVAATGNPSGYAARVNPIGTAAAYVTVPWLVDGLGFDLYITAMPTAAAGEVIVAHNGLEMRLTSGGKLTMWTNAPVLMATGVATLTTGQWYRIEIIEPPVSTTGTVAWQVNGVDDGSWTFTKGTAANWFMGKFSNRNGSGYDLRFDNLAAPVDSVTQLPVYTGNLFVVARQFVPIITSMNAWTKSTGITMDAMWNNTPWSNTTYAYAMASGLVQTGRNAAFNLSGVTPLSLKVAVVGKTSATSSSGNLFTLRTVVNGVVGDSPQLSTMTTADKYLDAYFTPPTTLSYLDTLEVGIIHGPSTRTQNVEDAWAMVAYIPGVVAPPTGKRVHDLFGLKPFTNIGGF